MRQSHCREQRDLVCWMYLSICTRTGEGEPTCTTVTLAGVMGSNTASVTRCTEFAASSDSGAIAVPFSRSSVESNVEAPALQGGRAYQLLLDCVSRYYLLISYSVSTWQFDI